MMPVRDLSPMRSIRRHLLVGVALPVLLAGGLVSWAATAELSGAVIAHGSLAVASSVKAIQHPSGGVVGEILVREGDKVKAGQVVLRFDPTEARANLKIVEKQIDEFMARQAREQAEQIEADAVMFPIELTSRVNQPEIARLLADEQRLFLIRLEAREGEKAQLRRKIEEYNEEIGGYDDQVAAKEQQLGLIAKELAGMRTLLEKKLVSGTRVNALERDESAIRGERGQYMSSAAAARQRIAEAELQILQVDHAMRTEVSRDLAEVRARLAELMERRTAARDLLSRIDVRAPQEGTIHELVVHTVGGVVRAGDTMMQIVPLDDELVVEAKIAPQDVNDVFVGQEVALKFLGVNQRISPELDGRVTRLAADVAQDQRTGAGFYTVRIAVSASEFARLNGVRPVPGMPVEAFIKTHERTALTYLTQPLMEQVSRTFREK